MLLVLERKGLEGICVEYFVLFEESSDSYGAGNLLVFHLAR